MLPHRREDLISKLALVRFDPDARCPQWLRFLTRISGDNEWLPRFLQRLWLCAYWLDERASVFLLYGVGANGKSTFLNTLLTLLGDYALQTPSDTVLARRDNSIPDDVARLKGSGIVAAIETEEDRRLSEARVKQFTGEDRVAARFLFGEWFEYIPQFKLFLAVNHKPKFHGGDEAMWRRIVLTPFSEKIPEIERDKELAQKLHAELSWILNWCLEGQMAKGGFANSPRSPSSNCGLSHRNGRDIRFPRYMLHV